MRKLPSFYCVKTTAWIALVLIAAAVATPASAEQDEGVFTMMAIVDGAYGGKVVAGDYEQAIDRITSSKARRDEFTYQTNLCVAYTKTGQLELAADACDAALAEVRKEESIVNRKWAFRRDLAVALSNRGVFRAVSGDSELAKEDFLEAASLRPGLVAPRKNLARLRQDA